MADMRIGAKLFGGKGLRRAYCGWEHPECKSLRHKGLGHIAYKRLACAVVSADYPRLYSGLCWPIVRSGPLVAQGAILADTGGARGARAYRANWTIRYRYKYPRRIIRYRYI